MLDKNAILASQDAISKVVEVPEWKGTVTIRQPSALEMASIVKLEGIPSMIELISACVVDEKGERLFVSEEDKAALGKRAWPVLNRLTEQIQSLGKEPEALEDEIKNLPKTDGVSSSTISA